MLAWQGRLRPRMLDAVAEPRRRDILNYVALQERPVGILSPAWRRQPSVSKHLGVLRSVGLVHGRRDGRRPRLTRPDETEAVGDADRPLHRPTTLHLAEGPARCRILDVGPVSARSTGRDQRPTTPLRRPRRRSQQSQGPSPPSGSRRHAGSSESGCRRSRRNDVRRTVLACSVFCAFVAPRSSAATSRHHRRDRCRRRRARWRPRSGPAATAKAISRSGV